MLRSAISIDLPSRETLRDKTVGEWFGSIFGKRPDLRSGQEVMTVSAYAVLEGLVDGFEAAGFNDVLSLSVDRHGVYVDQEERPDDLRLMHDVVRRSGALNRRFRELRLSFTHVEEELHVIAEVCLYPQVMLGDTEIKVNLSARIRGLEHQFGESAYDYRQRLRDFVQEPDALEPSKQLLDDITSDLAKALQECVPGAGVEWESTSVQLTRPNARQLSRYRSVRFDDERWGSRYRPSPAFPDSAYYDPFVFYYYDPFYDFMMWSLVSAVVEYHVWDYDYVSFYDPGGELIGYGHEIVYDDFYSEWDHYDGLYFDDGGEIAFVDDFPVYDIGEYADPIEADFYAHDEAWGLASVPVYDPVEEEFVSANYDEPAVHYDQAYGDDGLTAYESGHDAQPYQDDSGQLSGFESAHEAEPVHSYHDAPIDDWSAEPSDGGWDSGGDDHGW